MRQLKPLCQLLYAGFLFIPFSGNRPLWVLFLKETGFIGFAKRYRHYLYGFAALLILILLLYGFREKIVSIETRDRPIALEGKDKAEKEGSREQRNLFQLEKAGVVEWTLSAMFAHEAHQPIASLINYARRPKALFWKGKREDPLVQEALSEISTQADRDFQKSFKESEPTHKTAAYHEVKARRNLSGDSRSGVGFI